MKWNLMWDDVLLPQGAKGDPGLSPGQATKGEEVTKSLFQDSPKLVSC